MESCAGRRTGQCILRVSGPLSSETEASFLEQVRVETAPVVILDLSGVHYADSRGIAALIQLYKTFKREHRRLGLVALDERVQRVLEITRVKHFFAVFATLDEAQEAFIAIAGNGSTL